MATIVKVDAEGGISFVLVDTTAARAAVDVARAAVSAAVQSGAVAPLTKTALQQLAAAQAAIVAALEQ